MVMVAEPPVAMPPAKEDFERQHDQSKKCRQQTADNAEKRSEYSSSYAEQSDPHRKGDDQDKRDQNRR